MNTLVWLSLILNAMTLFYIIKHETFKEKQHDELIKLVEQRIKKVEEHVDSKLYIVCTTMKKWR